MEYIVGLILLLAGYALYERSNRKKAQQDVLIAETKGRDEELKKEYEEANKQIEALDEGIKEMKKKRSAQIPPSKEGREKRWENE